MRPLNLEWFRSVPENKKKEHESGIRRGNYALTHLLMLVNQWEEELDRSESKVSDYDSPSWSAKQAHRNGDRSRIRKLKDLLSFLQGESK